MAGSDKRLVPARPAAAEDTAGYMPRIPWRYVLLGLLSVATVTGGFMLKEKRKADAWRAQIIQVHEKELAEPARRYIEFRNKLQGLIIEASRKAPDSCASPPKTRARRSASSAARWPWRATRSPRASASRRPRRAGSGKRAAS